MTILKRLSLSGCQRDGIGWAVKNCLGGIPFTRTGVLMVCIAQLELEVTKKPLLDLQAEVQDAYGVQQTQTLKKQETRTHGFSTAALAILLMQQTIFKGDS